MTKQKLNIAELILQGISLLCLFLPWMYTWEHWVLHKGGGQILSASFPMSFFDVMGNVSILVGLLVIAAMVANCCFIMVPMFKGYGKKFGVMHKILPVAAAALLTAFTIIAAIEDYYGYCAVPNWLFYFEAFFVLAVVLLAFLKCSPNVKTQKRKIVQSDNAAMLKKYKELLDENIITQEEFEAKKKQLLDL